MRRRRCSFCSYEFNPDDAEITCTGCPLTKNCHLICCPRCGYTMPPEAKLIGWLRRLHQGWRSESSRLSQLRKIRSLRDETK